MRVEKPPQGRPRRWRVLAAAGIALVAAAPPRSTPPAPDEGALARAIGDRVAGAPVDCLPVGLSLVTATEIVPGTAIVYRIGARLYVNRPRGGAEALRRDDILITRIVTGQLCRNDPVTLADPTSPIPRGVIVLGDFVPYARAMSGRGG